MEKVTFRQRISYAFDNIMTKGTLSLIAGLAILSVLVVLFISLVALIFGIGPEGATKVNFISSFWMSLMRTLDPGTMGDDQGWTFRMLMLLVTIFGILMVSTLIGIVSRGILDRVENLRKGRSFVIEQNHVLLLGWSSKIFTIISELVIANENQKNPCIVILAEKDKVEMEDEIKTKVGSTKNTKIICRSGNPIDIEDLYIVNPFETKSIIILDQENENSDSQVIKTILAITSNPGRRSAPYHITAEIKEEKNLEVAKMVGKDEVELILSDMFIAWIMVQTGRQSGLSVVYTEFMDFDGDEIYFNEEKKLIGKQFGEALFAYKDSTVMGLQLASGEVILKPDFETLIKEGDKIIAVTEDDDTMIVSKDLDYPINHDAITSPAILDRNPERILMLGWNKRSPVLINELDKHVMDGSLLKVVVNHGYARKQIKKITPSLTSLQVEFIEEDTTDKYLLTSLDPPSFDHIILQSEYEDVGVQQADAQTLVTLLHLRNISTSSDKDLNIVSEMLDNQNRRLAEVTNADDFIVSDNVLSLLMSQVSENKYLMDVFYKLFGSKESGVYIKPVTGYLNLGQPVNFYTVLESARQQKEVALGYRIMARKNDENLAHGVVVNPLKTEMISFSKEDKIIVLSDEDFREQPTS
jgi:voltage-gated potassium channel Kch